MKTSKSIVYVRSEEEAKRLTEKLGTKNIEYVVTPSEVFKAFKTKQEKHLEEEKAKKELALKAFRTYLYNMDRVSRAHLKMKLFGTCNVSEEEFIEKVLAQIKERNLINKLKRLQNANKSLLDTSEDRDDN